MLAGTSSQLWGLNAGPHEFEGIFEAKNLVLELRLQLGCG